MVDVEKYHGTGNDFVVVDADEDVPNRRAFAVELCDREHGIDHPASERRGADGVLFLALEPAYNPPRIVMTLVQPDGSVAGMCGNGARCAAKWAAERTGADEVMIDTPSGTRHADVDGDDVTIEMGAPVFDPEGVPVDRDEPLVEETVEGLTVTAVNTGVPHAVAFVEEVDAVDLESVAPPVRHADVFPDGANVTLASPTPEGGFRQRTFERGVEGETRSCGTGAVAVAAVAHRLGRIEAGATVTVSPPGGDLRVTVEEGNSYLEGPVVFEFAAEVPTVETDPEPVDASGD
ncbi:diaminopimelate epimerase [Salinirubellus salinus]|jgi:diaminopimelate epimerase|uniref:Diaminopimelate epimerase n=1 Tax=Salinirubellus salinus TaxID=1364945 RepID=A0A9E7R5I6_9EURY|nr:diaminopimelate epimerase [Salinirubellus salinus]UWM55045.1 diaminopimelate epimerase [Salinirubellus salinus]